MKVNEFNELFTHCQNELGLVNWQITKKISKNIADNIDGYTDAKFIYQQGHITFNRAVLKETTEYVKEVIIHELLHCLLGFRKQDLETIARQFMNDNEFALFVSSIQMKEEIATTQLARVLNKYIKLKNFKK